MPQDALRRVNGHEIKSHGFGQEVSETKLGTFTRLLIPTEDQKMGQKGFFSLVNVPSFISDTSCPDPWDFNS